MQVDNKTSIDKLAETLANLVVANLKIGLIKSEIEHLDAVKAQMNDLDAMLDRMIERNERYMQEHNING